MNGFAKYIEMAIGQEPENKLLEASVLYRNRFSSVPEMSFYKTLERMCKKGKLVHLSKGIYYRPRKTRLGVIPISEKDIIHYYTGDGRGIVVGYALYNRKGLTTQISKQVEILSSGISGQKKNINNICVMRCDIEFSDDTIAVVETMEILQNHNKIEDISFQALAAYMKGFAAAYSDSAAVYVLNHKRYKKSAIAFLESFLSHFDVSNTLHTFLSPLSKYDIPDVEDFYESV